MGTRLFTRLDGAHPTGAAALPVYASDGKRAVYCAKGMWVWVWVRVRVRVRVGVGVAVVGWLVGWLTTLDILTPPRMEW